MHAASLDGERLAGSNHDGASTGEVYLQSALQHQETTRLTGGC